MSQDKTQGIYITQEDIDTVLQAARRQETISDTDDGKPLFLDESDIVDSGLEGDSEEAEYFGLLSKEDIEALLHGDLDGSSRREAQDEIDSLFQTTGAGKERPAAGEAAPSDKKNTAQEDVERLIQAAGDGDGPGETAGEKTPEGDSAVSQDDIDRLLTGALDDGGDGADEPGGAGSPETDLQGVGEVLSQDDLDRLLSGASVDDGEDVEPEFSEAAFVEPETGGRNDAESVPPGGMSESFDETESLISQSDLDQLMGGGPAAGGVSDVHAGGFRSTSEHISQDDINRLLKESLDEAEDLLGGEADSAVADESDLQEPVILAADEEPAEPTFADSKPAPAEKIRKTAGDGGWKKRIRSKRLVWAAAAGIFLFISVTALMMSSEPTETAPQPRVMTFSLNQTGGDSPGATVLSDTRIRLPGFVVLAPPNSASVTYVAVDLTLEVSNTATVAVIKENEAFVRDIIYGTIRNELVTRDISTIDEISLEPAIRKALGRVVAREAIGRIAFDRFSLV